MNFFEIMGEMLAQSGFAALTWKNLVMFAISFILLYFAIKKQYEPLLLLPIAFGMFLANLPLADLMKESEPWYTQGVLRIMYGGVKSSLFPCLIFLCVGAMTDFGPLIANPISLLLGAAAQFGIYIAFMLANATGLFTVGEAAAIGIIGGADGPTAIYIANNLAPDLVAPIAVAAYSYETAYHEKREIHCYETAPQGKQSRESSIPCIRSTVLFSASSVGSPASGYADAW